MPFRATLRPARDTLYIRVSSPQVEVRPLGIYEAYAEGGGGALP